MDVARFALSFTATVAEYPDCGVDGPTKDAPLKIPPGKSATFSVVYTPTSKATRDPATGDFDMDVANVAVQTDGWTQMNTFTCSGVGVTHTCPTSVVSTQGPLDVIPQTSLQLKGDASFGVGGAQVTEYSWTVKQPKGSQQNFQPGADVANPKFTANVVGTYEFCLSVRDSLLLQSCSPACIQASVSPDAALHLELTWKTPGDADPSDTGAAAGADLDLHFAHPLASVADIDCDGQGDPWFSDPFDAYWVNKEPNWGSFDPNVDDDPKLILEDTDGAGPELLSLAQPQGTNSDPMNYAIGVHYWNDHDHGPSEATLNVFIGGVLAGQFGPVKMYELDMWYVGKLQWPNKMVGGSLPPVQRCYSSKVGSPCQGSAKFWQPEGVPCISACYVNPALLTPPGWPANSSCSP